MRSLVLGTAGAVLFLSAADATDIYGSYAPILPWTGFYLGANGGYARANRTASFTPNDANAQVITCGGASMGACPGPAAVNLEGGLGGLQVGYNWQWGNWLAGLETDFDWAQIHGKGTSAFMLGAAPSNLQAIEDLDWFGTLRARVGPKLSDNILTYMTGGLAYGSVHDNARLNSLAGSNATAGGSAIGWSAGTGIEYSFRGNISLKMEYLYVDLGSGHTISAVAQSGGGGAIPSSFTAAVNENNLHIFRFGVNYQFVHCCEQLK